MCGALRVSKHEMRDFVLGAGSKNRSRDEAGVAENQRCREAVGTECAAARYTARAGGLRKRQMNTIEATSGESSSEGGEKSGQRYPLHDPFGESQPSVGMPVSHTVGGNSRPMSAGSRPIVNPYLKQSRGSVSLPTSNAPIDCGTTSNDKCQTFNAIPNNNLENASQTQHVPSQRRTKPNNFISPQTHIVNNDFLQRNLSQQSSLRNPYAEKSHFSPFHLATGTSAASASLASNVTITALSIQQKYSKSQQQRTQNTQVPHSSPTRLTTNNITITVPSNQQHHSTSQGLMAEIIKTISSPTKHAQAPAENGNTSTSNGLFPLFLRPLPSPQSPEKQTKFSSTASENASIDKSNPPSIRFRSSAMKE